MKSPFATGVGSVLRPMAPGAVEKQGKKMSIEAAKPRFHWISHSKMLILIYFYGDFAKN
jgi:hypothetical protein